MLQQIELQFDNFAIVDPCIVAIEKCFLLDQMWTFFLYFWLKRSDDDTFIVRPFFNEDSSTCSLKEPWPLLSPADLIVFFFFGVGSAAEILCFNSCFVSGV